MACMKAFEMLREHRAQIGVRQDSEDHELLV